MWNSRRRFFTCSTDIGTLASWVLLVISWNTLGFKKIQCLILNPRCQVTVFAKSYRSEPTLECQIMGWWNPWSWFTTYLQLYVQLVCKNKTNILTNLCMHLSEVLFVMSTKNQLQLLCILRYVAFKIICISRSFAYGIM